MGLTKDLYTVKNESLCKNLRSLLMRPLLAFEEILNDYSNGIHKIKV